MNTKCVATQNARKYTDLSQYMINWSLVLLIIILMLSISCAKSDDLETINNETPIDNDPPIDTTPTIDIDTVPTIDSESLIIYTDIEPDYVSDNLNVYYDLDINNDGNVDYNLSLWNDDSTDYLLLKSSPNSNNTFYSVNPWYANTVPLDNGTVIFDRVSANIAGYYEHWGVFTLGNCFGGDPSCSYDWKNKNDKFLGLRFLIDGQTHYGWVRMDVTSATQWVIKDYAYNATPNEPILAGQKE